MSYSFLCQCLAWCLAHRRYLLVVCWVNKLYNWGIVSGRSLRYVRERGTCKVSEDERWVGLLNSVWKRVHLSLKIVKSPWIWGQKWGRSVVVHYILGSKLWQ